jgi:hypothetical protein
VAIQGRARISVKEPDSPVITSICDVIVLVVADDDDTRVVVGLLLEQSGVHVYGVNWVQEVLAVLSGDDSSSARTPRRENRDDRHGQASPWR